MTWRGVVMDMETLTCKSKVQIQTISGGLKSYCSQMYFKTSIQFPPYKAHHYSSVLLVTQVYFVYMQVALQVFFKMAIVSHNQQ